MDAELTKKIYGRVPVLIDEALGEQGNPWGIKFMRMFDMSNDSDLFFDEPASDRLPLYEAKLIHHYDHRWATYNPDGSSIDLTQIEKQDSNFLIKPRYWAESSEVQARLKAHGWEQLWLMGWRNIAKTQNERTLIATITPRVLAIRQHSFSHVNRPVYTQCFWAVLRACLATTLLDKKWEEPT